MHMRTHDEPNTHDITQQEEVEEEEEETHVNKTLASLDVETEREDSITQTSSILERSTTIHVTTVEPPTQETHTR